MVRLGLAAAAALAAAGCVTEAGEEKVARLAENSARAPLEAGSPLYRSVSLGVLKGGHTGNPDSLNVVSRKQFVQAIEGALAQRAMNAPAESRYRLDAELVRSSHPLLAATTVRVTTEARYTLRDAASGAVLFETTVVSEGSAGMGDSVIYYSRIGLAAGAALVRNTLEMTDRLVEAGASGAVR